MPVECRLLSVMCSKMATLDDVLSLYKNLKDEWTAVPCNLKKCGELLNQLKVIHDTNINFLIIKNHLQHSKANQQCNLVYL